MYDNRVTLLCRWVAILLAAWISPEFANWGVELVELYLTNQLTPTYSAAAAAAVAEVVTKQQNAGFGRLAGEA